VQILPLGNYFISIYLYSFLTKVFANITLKRLIRIYLKLEPDEFMPNTPYLEKAGREKMARAVKDQIGSEGQDLNKAKERVEAEKERISSIINNLLDNITSTNRQYVDTRLDELKKQRQQLEDRLEELERLSLSQAEIDNIVTEAMQFLSGLVFTLHQGLPQEKLVALRQCIEKIRVNKPAGEIKLAVCQVPAGNLQDTIEVKIFV
jgi:vacuolar-type H+-ATPase subunit I/STV1